MLYDALFLSADDVLAKQTGRRALIVLTDGVDRHSKESLTEAIEAAQRANVVVYAIYLKGETHREFNPGARRGGYGGYGGYPGGGNYPGSGGRPGSDGTYAEPDGKKSWDASAVKPAAKCLRSRAKALSKRSMHKSAKSYELNTGWASHPRKMPPPPATTKSTSR